MVTSSYATAISPLLEKQLRSKLKLARIKRISDCSEVAGPLVHADAAIVGIALELGMVPCVEGLDAELEMTARASLMTKFLASDRFQLSRPGPREASNPRLP